MTDPGHLLPPAEWARVQADARHAAVPGRALRAVPKLGRSSFPSVTGFVQCKYDGGAQPSGPTFGVLHDAETPLAAGYAASIASYFTRNTNETSAHFMVDPVATVQMLDTSRVAWHCGNGNTRSVGVEQAGYAAFTAAQWTTPAGLQQMARVAALMRDLHATHGIGLFWMTDQQLIDAHAGRIVGGWATHAQCSRVLGGSTHTDPIPNYPFGQLMATATGGTPTPGGLDMANVPDAEWAELLDRVRGVTFPLPGHAIVPSGYVPQDSLVTTETNKLVKDIDAKIAQVQPTVDASAVASALAADSGFLAALAKAVNDDAARRLSS